MLRTAVTAGLTWLTSAAVAAPLVSEPVEDRWKWYALPTFSVDTDDGLGMGWRAEAAREAEGVTPYRTGLVTQGYFSTRGFVDIRFQADFVDRGPSDNLRVTSFAALRRWKNDGYWGVGQGTSRAASVLAAQKADPDGTARQHYRYELLQPISHTLVRWDLAPPVALHAALQLKWSRVTPYADSLLSESVVPGIDGGLGVQLLAGGMVDTRDNEIDPQSGFWLEVTGRASLPVPGGAGAFVGGLVSWRHYGQLGPNLVVAYRAMGEVLVGDVPFYEMVHWGTSVPIAGFGGANGLRAVRFGRYRGPGKAIWNSELRWTVWRPTVRGEALAVELAPWVDAGVVFLDGVPRQAGVWPVHPAAGAGVRLVYAGQFTGRLDAGYGHDPILLDDGSLQEAATFGFYLTFGHAF